MKTEGQGNLHIFLVGKENTVSSDFFHMILKYLT